MTLEADAGQRGKDRDSSSSPVLDIRQQLYFRGPQLPCTRFEEPGLPAARLQVKPWYIAPHS